MSRAPLNRPKPRHHEWRYASTAVDVAAESDQVIELRVGRHRHRLTIAAAEKLMRQLRLLPPNRSAII